MDTPTPSALDLLPDFVRVQITHKDPRLRDDLRLIPEAEATGWKVSFRNDSWHNAAMFAKDGVHVWSTGYDWRSAWYAPDGTRGEITPHRLDEAGLRSALGLVA